MHITLNGDAREFPLDTTVNELLETLGYAGKRRSPPAEGLQQCSPFFHHPDGWLATCYTITPLSRRPGES